jgi:hypothetical protein
MSDQALTEQWLRWSTDSVTQEANIILADMPDEPLGTPDIELLEADPIIYLQQSAAWMSYYNTNVTLWMSAHKKLETRYTTLKDKCIVKYLQTEPKLAIAKAEAMARVELEALREAITIAENKSRSWMTKYVSAQTSRDLISRAITARESDRKVNRQW